MRRTSRRRLLLALLALTLLLMSFDLAGGPGPGLLRSAAGAAFGPLESLVTRSRGGGEASTRGLLDTAQRARRSVEEQQVSRLLAASDLAGSALLPARVVAVGRQSAAGPERVTIDVGSRDGARVDQCVVSADGLVGRVVAVSPWTADVLLLGSADLVVGVRVGATGTLGSVGSGGAGVHRRPAGLLNLEAVQRGTVRDGDPVTTLGSAGGSPFPAGLPVGEVTAVDTARGSLAATGAVRPAVDPTALDVVGVVLSTTRSVPRAAVTGGT